MPLCCKLAPKSWRTLASTGTVPPTRCAEQPANRKTCRCNTPHRGHVDCCGTDERSKPYNSVATADLIFRTTGTHLLEANQLFKLNAIRTQLEQLENGGPILDV